MLQKAVDEDGDRDGGFLVLRGAFLGLVLVPDT
jgi:hypothetical protein